VQGRSGAPAAIRDGRYDHITAKTGKLIFCPGKQTENG
jgi:hypothetical protein